MNEKLMPFIEAIKSGKTIHYGERQDLSDSKTGPDFKDTDIYIKYISENCLVETKENIAYYPDNEYNTTTEQLSWQDFLNWVQQFQDKVHMLKIIE